MVFLSYVGPGQTDFQPETSNRWTVFDDEKKSYLYFTGQLYFFFFFAK